MPVVHAVCAIEYPVIAGPPFVLEAVQLRLTWPIAATATTLVGAAGTTLAKIRVVTMTLGTLVSLAVFTAETRN